MSVPVPCRVCLTDLDPDLADDLPPEAFAAVRSASLPGIDLDVGSWRPEDIVTRGPLVGCLVVSGLVSHDVGLADRVCSHLCGPRDFLSTDRLDDGSLPTRVEFNVLVPSRIALLDDAVLALGRSHPRILGRLLAAATRQVGHVSADQAIAQLPHVEDRLLALFWRLADRWGHRRRNDVVVDMPLTHDALGRLIGARRPTVSLGLRRLAEDGRLTRCGACWVLAPDSLEHLDARPHPQRTTMRRHTSPAPPPVTLGPQREGLRTRLAALQVTVAAERVRAEAALDNTRAIRERIARGRADRRLTPGAP